VNRPVKVFSKQRYFSKKTIARVLIIYSFGFGSSRSNEIDQRMSRKEKMENGKKEERLGFLLN